MLTKKQGEIVAKEFVDLIANARAFNVGFVGSEEPFFSHEQISFLYHLASNRLSYLHCSDIIEQAAKEQGYHSK